MPGGVSSAPYNPGPAKAMAPLAPDTQALAIASQLGRCETSTVLHMVLDLMRTPVCNCVTVKGSNRLVVTAL